MPFVAAAFDFDETMIDLEAQHGFASEALARELGADFMELPESFRTRSGSRVIDDVAEMREHFGWREPLGELLERRQRHFMRACEESDLALMPGISEAVRALHAAGFRLAVTSSAVGDAIDAILRRVGLRELFELIVDGGAVTRGKPDPEAYLVTAARLGVEPQQCIVFEDSCVGVVAAKRAGAYCVAVRNPRAHVRQDLSDADVIVEREAE
jgi:HAD superfamily hydrolase (TIGR01509 family)